MSRGAGLSQIQLINVVKEFAALNLNFRFDFFHRKVRIWIFMLNTLIWLNSSSV